VEINAAKLMGMIEGATAGGASDGGGDAAASWAAAVLGGGCGTSEEFELTATTGHEGKKTQGTIRVRIEAREVLVVRPEKATGLVKADLIGSADPYCKVLWNGGGAGVGATLAVHGHGLVGKTKVVKSSLAPVWWSESGVSDPTDFHIVQEQGAMGQYEMPLSELRVEVWDSDTTSADDFLGQASIFGDGLCTRFGRLRSGYRIEQLCPRPGKRPPKKGYDKKTGQVDLGRVGLRVHVASKLRVQLLSAKNLAVADMNGKADPYVRVVWEWDASEEAEAVGVDADGDDGKDGDGGEDGKGVQSEAEEERKNDEEDDDDDEEDEEEEGDDEDDDEDEDEEEDTFGGAGEGKWVRSILGRTETRSRTLNPWWEPSTSIFETHLPLDCGRARLRLQVFDSDLIGKDEFLGEVVVQGDRVDRFKSDVFTLPVKRMMASGAGAAEVNAEQDLVRGHLNFTLFVEDGGTGNSNSAVHQPFNQGYETALAEEKAVHELAKAGAQASGKRVGGKVYDKTPEEYEADLRATRATQIETALMTRSDANSLAAPQLAQLAEDGCWRPGGWARPLNALQVAVKDADGLAKADTGPSQWATSDPYCMVQWNNKKLPDDSTKKGDYWARGGKTAVIPKSLNPKWADEMFEIPLPKLVLQVWDHDTLGSDDFLGEASLEGVQLLRALGVYDGGATGGVPAASIAFTDGAPVLLPLTGRHGKTKDDKYIADGGGNLVVSLRKLDRFTIQLKSASKLSKADTFGKSDPYAAVHVLPKENCDWAVGGKLTDGGLKKGIAKGGTLVGKTEVIKSNLDPVWADHSNQFTAEIPAEGGCVLVDVWDHDTIGSGEFLGELVIKTEQLHKLMEQPARPWELKLQKKRGRGKEKKWSQYVGKEAKVTITVHRAKEVEVHVIRAEGAGEDKGAAFKESDVAALSRKAEAGDPYCRLYWNGRAKEHEVGRTKHVKSSLRPEWNEEQHHSKFVLPRQVQQPMSFTHLFSSPPSLPTSRFSSHPLTPSPRPLFRPVCPLSRPLRYSPSPCSTMITSALTIPLVLPPSRQTSTACFVRVTSVAQYIDCHCTQPRVRPKARRRELKGLRGFNSRRCRSYGCTW
jgi:hypothetical protein